MPAANFSSHADQSAPGSSKARADQKIDGMSTERVAIQAHLGSEPAEMAVIGCIKKTGQDNEKT